MSETLLQHMTIFQVAMSIIVIVCCAVVLVIIKKKKKISTTSITTNTSTPSNFSPPEDCLSPFEKHGFIRFPSYRPNQEYNLKHYKDELYSVKQFKRLYPNAPGFVCIQEQNPSVAFLGFCDPTLIEEIQVEKEKYYERDITISYVSKILGNCIVFNLQDRWKLKRKIYGQMFHFSHQSHLCELAKNLTLKQLDKYKDGFDLNGTVELLPWFESILAEWSLRLFFGESADYPDLIDRLKYHYNNARQAIIFLNPQNMQKCLDPLKEVLKEFLAITIKKIKEDKDYRLHPQNNITWHLMCSNEVELEGEFINEVCEDITIFFFAGRDTMAHTLQMVVYYLCKYKKYYTEILKEIQAINDSGSQNLSSAKYLDAVMKETLRHYGPTTTVLPKIAMEEHTLLNGKLFIPENTIVSLAVQELHYDPAYYPQPDEFLPERWFDPTLKAQIKKVFMPFSYGPHKCIGDQLALPVMKTVLVTLLDKVKIEIDKDYKLELVALIQYTPRRPVVFQIQEKEQKDKILEKEEEAEKQQQENENSVERLINQVKQTNNQQE